MREDYKRWFLKFGIFVGWVLTGLLSTIYIGSPVHEFGHRLMLNYYNMEIVDAGWNFVRTSATPNIPVILAGPIIAIIFGGVVHIASRMINNTSLRHHFYAAGFFIVAVDGFFNLLPIHIKSDGYRIFTILGWL